MAATLVTVWKGSMIYLDTDRTIFVIPSYALFLDLSDSSTRPYIRIGYNSSPTLTQYFIGLTNSDGTKGEADTKALLPINLSITIGDDTTPYDLTMGTGTNIISDIVIPPQTNWIIRPRQLDTNLYIPNDGLPFTISTDITIRYGTADAETYHFTQNACGALFNQMTGVSSNLLTGMLYEYNFTNAVKNTGNYAATVNGGYVLPKQNTPANPFYPTFISGGEFDYAGYCLKTYEIPELNSQRNHFNPTFYGNGFNGDLNKYGIAVKSRAGRPNGYTAPASSVWREGSTTYSYTLKIIFIQKYTGDHTGFYENLVIGYSQITPTKATVRSEVDDALKPTITGHTLTATCSNRDPIQRYGALVATRTTCTLTLETSFVCGDYAERDTYYNKAEIYADGQIVETVLMQSNYGTNRIYRFIFSNIPVCETLTVRVQLHGTVWGLDSNIYTFDLPVIEYTRPSINYFTVERCRLKTTDDESADFTYNGTEYVYDETGNKVKMAWDIQWCALNNGNVARARIRKPRYENRSDLYTDETINVSGYRSTDIRVEPASPDLSFGWLSVCAMDDLSSFHYTDIANGYSQPSEGDYETLTLDSAPAVMEFIRYERRQSGQQIEIKGGIGVGKRAHNTNVLDLRSNWKIYLSNMLIEKYDGNNDRELKDIMNDIEQALFQKDGQLFY